MQVDERLPGKGNSNSHGARPVHLIITTKKRIRTSTLSIKNYPSAGVMSSQALTPKHVSFFMYQIRER